jgi:hypothetical protein
LFATERSFEAGRVRLLADEELSDDERAKAHRLEQELLAMHPAALMTVPLNPPPQVAGWPMDDFWRFDETQDVTIVCAKMPQNLTTQMPYADPADPDFVELHRYADLDALLELYGHLRAVNPRSTVAIRLADSLRSDDYTGHLVVLGGVDWNEVTRELLSSVRLPVNQVSSNTPGGAAFEVAEGGERRLFSPVLRDGELLEDVAHFYRAPNPFNRARTVTICNGIFGRGTLAAVRSLTDARFRKRNAEYVLRRFGRSERFSILARTHIQKTEALTPDWSDEDIRLHEWPK